MKRKMKDMRSPKLAALSHSKVDESIQTKLTYRIVKGKRVNKSKMETMILTCFLHTNEIRPQFILIQSGHKTYVDARCKKPL